ncbi:capping complex subunit for YIEGIA [Gorillibacterium massiliense]|uniref:capping complex subunit for YIEGIA n=1 Tax=Gorillibacterium massiliense TaxID=1280390 RepID=UPI0004BBF2E4|nr:hypothetical protein [Gorillibacterium massiliense]
MNDNSRIVAVVAMDHNEVGGGAPMFFVANSDELQQVANTLEKIMDASVAEITPTVMILVKH